MALFRLRRRSSSARKNNKTSRQDAAQPRRGTAVAQAGNPKIRPAPCAQSQRRNKTRNKTARTRSVFFFFVAGATARPSSLFSSLKGLEREPETCLTTGGAPLRLVVELRVGVEGRLTALSMLIRSASIHACMCACLCIHTYMHASIHAYCAHTCVPLAALVGKPCRPGIACTATHSRCRCLRGQHLWIYLAFLFVVGVDSYYLRCSLLRPPL